MTNYLYGFSEEELKFIREFRGYLDCVGITLEEFKESYPAKDVSLAIKRKQIEVLQEQIKEIENND